VRLAGAPSGVQRPRIQQFKACDPDKAIDPSLCAGHMRFIDGWRPLVDWSSGSANSYPTYNPLLLKKYMIYQ
jgi:hypothetical protein